MQVVTGVFSFTGGFVARELLARGEQVKTLSRRPDPAHRLAGEVAFGRLQFEDEAALTAELRGADTLFNTYWIRFPREEVTWEAVVENTRMLLRAAREAGVRRIVQFSVTNADERSPFGYFRAKALAERALRESGVSHAVVRPTLVFGSGDILLNNVAWALRRFPAFAVPSGSGYEVQPIAGTDLARIAVDLGARSDDVAIDAGGPARHTFAELARLVRDALGRRAAIVRVPSPAVLGLSRLASLALGDVLVTRDELAALRESLLVAGDEPAGRTPIGEWLAAEADGLGRRFASERTRNWR
jgi:NADH dehydrogenase